MAFLHIKTVNFGLWLVMFGGLLSHAVSSTSNAQRSKNVLMLVVDDLRPELSPYQDDLHQRVHTPNIEQLAQRSLVFQRAYVQQAVCAPSRASFLTGRRPDTTHVYDIHSAFREKGGNFTTLPQYFKQHGYHTIGMGKVFHGSKVTGGEDPPSWTEPFYSPRYLRQWTTRRTSWMAVPERRYATRPLPDQAVAAKAIETLQRFGNRRRQGEDDNFFLTVGFRKPHLPFVFPEEYLQYYPLQNISLPANPFVPRKMPRIAWSSWGELRNYRDIKPLGVSGKENVTLPDEWTLSLRRAYLASVTYIDDLVGQVLGELESQGLANDTVVAFFGDHGWMLGEHGGWCKHNNFELSTRVPLMMHVPGRTDGGLVTDKLVELVDIFPSLAEAAGLPLPAVCPENSNDVALCREGSSFLPLVDNPGLAWKNSAFSQYPRKSLKVMGYTVRTAHFRYTEWVKFDPDTYTPDWATPTRAVELYDHRTDPQENYNVAKQRRYRAVRRELKTTLRRGWRGAMSDIQSPV